MTEPDLQGTDPRILARFLDVEDAPRRLWSPEELGAILRHQLDSSVQLDLETLGAPLASRLQALPVAHQPGRLTFRDLFQLADPALELLNLVKLFAKASRVRGESVLPAEIATVIYLTSIVLARLRRERRITEQSDESLLYGIQWVIDQPWVDEKTHALFREALVFYKRQAPRGDAF
ncbi:MAG TPA: hypothetical protein VKE94_24525 [Gemmataceae bacterium]|nr:hypothetical protein [Gemmataceae bacterium]